jgi:hypothetical protein
MKLDKYKNIRLRNLIGRKAVLGIRIQSDPDLFVGSGYFDRIWIRSPKGAYYQ